MAIATSLFILLALAIIPQASSRLHNSDAPITPCDDFYGYVCGEQSESPFADVFINIADRMATGLAEAERSKEDLLPPIKQLVELNRQCVEAWVDWNATVGNGAALRARMKEFEATTGLGNPLLDTHDRLDEWLTPHQLATTIGYLGGRLSHPSLITFDVGTNYNEPQGEQPYVLVFGQSQLLTQLRVHSSKVWESRAESRVEEELMQWLKDYLWALRARASEQRLTEAVRGIARLEHVIATHTKWERTQERNHSRRNNPFQFAQLKSKYSQWLDFEQFLRQLTSHGSEAVKTRVLEDDFQYILEDPRHLEDVLKLISPDNSFGITARQVRTYLLFHALVANRRLFPDAPNKASERTAKSYLRKFKANDLSNFGRIPGVPIHGQQLDVTARELTVESVCAQRSAARMQYASARFYLDLVLPGVGQRMALKRDVGVMVENILSAFRSMIDGLSWMSAGSKKGVHKKIDGLVKNVAYPNFIFDDHKLSEYYADLKTQASYVESLAELRRFLDRIRLEDLLVRGATNREDWRHRGPLAVNAWYNCELNSITIPYAIIFGFYSKGQPAAVNYGRLGTIIGHELAHAFDDQGIQFNEVGRITPWMDDQSQIIFRSMADCIVEEYAGFCPLNATEHKPNCLDGRQTQGENIADNAGIRAAFRAYRLSHRNCICMAKNGELTQEQLALQQRVQDRVFFHNFASNWCGPKPEDPEAYSQQLLNDPHSPGPYRVSGTLQNLPHFQWAFNCPFDSKSVPNKQGRCTVWEG